MTAGNKPTIFVYSEEAVTHNGAPYIALAEDGTIVLDHYCSSDEWAKNDLGLGEGGAERDAGRKAHRDYMAHYKHRGGYRLEFVPYLETRSHEALQAARKKRPVGRLEHNVHQLTTSLAIIARQHLWDTNRASLSAMELKRLKEDLARAEQELEESKT